MQLPNLTSLEGVEYREENEKVLKRENILSLTIKFGNFIYTALRDKNENYKQI